ncbi:MAG: hypothetical protein ABR584_00185 [Candidatus Baltobacteraceae bacterium]
MPSISASPSPAPLVANPASIATNIGVQQIIAITGATGPLTATLDNKVASVAVSGFTIVLGPVRNGTAALHVVDTVTNAAIDIPVRIAPNAGTIAPQILLKVTGGSVDPAFVASQAQLALNRATLVAPGATIQVGQIAPPALPMTTGNSATLSVPIKIAGGTQYLDIDGTTQITVQNVGAQPFTPGLLYYSDDPERTNADGVLYRGTITDAQPVRLYDYHENGTDPRRLVIALTAASTAPSSVQTVGRFAGPNPDVMTVGHAVTRDFMVNKVRNQGVVFDLTNDAPLLLDDVLMHTRDGVASSTDFKVLSGGPVNFTVLAVSPGSSPLTLLDGPQLPGDGRSRHGVFSLANYGVQSMTYAAGAVDTTTDIGDREPTVPSVNADQSGKDFGDYGVLFNFNIALSNPTATPQTVYLYESPRGGPARASYLIDSDAMPIELGCATSARSSTELPHRYQIRAFTLAAGASETHVVRTMTDGGSNLPIVLGLSIATPQPTTPPISAPDGCFPKPDAALPAPAPTPTPE